MSKIRSVLRERILETKPLPPLFRRSVEFRMYCRWGVRGLYLKLFPEMSSSATLIRQADYGQSAQKEGVLHFVAKFCSLQDGAPKFRQNG